jgi:hypothetical protein
VTTAGVSAKKAWRCLALFLNFAGAVLLCFAITIRPAADAGGSRDTYATGETAAMVTSEHLSLLTPGWVLMGLGFMIQFVVEVLCD